MIDQVFFSTMIAYLQKCLHMGLCQPIFWMYQNLRSSILHCMCSQGHYLPLCLCALFYYHAEKQIQHENKIKHDEEWSYY